jgi:hypothetical protein
VTWYAVRLAGLHKTREDVDSRSQDKVLQRRGHANGVGSGRDRKKARTSPKLDRIYRERKNQGFIVFGLSQEDADLQRKFVEHVPVSYPLLTVRGSVPQIYRDIAR